jgi:hypothetical protein
MLVSRFSGLPSFTFDVALSAWPLSWPIFNFLLICAIALLPNTVISRSLNSAAISPSLAFEMRSSALGLSRGTSSTVSRGIFFNAYILVRVRFGSDIRFCDFKIWSRYWAPFSAAIRTSPRWQTFVMRPAAIYRVEQG